MMNQNICLMTDSYKLTHWGQYPSGTEHVYSYFESRGGAFKELVFFGMQYILKRYFTGSCFTQDDILHADAFSRAHFGQPLFNRAGWERLLEKHGGRLPVKIRAVKEGSVIPTRNVLITIENTDPEFHWLTNFLETILVQMWYPITVASQSYAIKKVVRDYREKTGGIEGLPFAVHDFGYRGSTSYESSAIGGAAHLVNFMGTDTLSAIELIHQFYTKDLRPGDDGLFAGSYPDEYEKALHAWYSNHMPAFSVPASEHSTMTSWGQEHEVDACRNMLEKYPTGIVSVVSDSWDIIRCCREIWGDKLKQEVIERNGKLVVRPDSGKLPGIVIAVLRELEAAFGSTPNEQGYRVFPDFLGVIQGDGMEFLERNTFDDVLGAMEHEGFSASNIVFGSGGGLLQKVNRDTCRFAFKCSHATINGQSVDVFKQPVSDMGKKSKRGRLALVRQLNGSIVTQPEDWVSLGEDLLEDVFVDGKLLRDQDFTEVRENVQ